MFIKAMRRGLPIFEGVYVNFGILQRDVWYNEIMCTSGQVIGPGMIVEIDESLFVWRKNNVGRLTLQQGWGGELNVFQRVFFNPRRLRNVETLLPSIRGNLCQVLQ